MHTLTVTSNITFKEEPPIGDYIGKYPAYKAVPTFACTIGEYALYRHRVLTGPHNAYLPGRLAEDGYETK